MPGSLEALAGGLEMKNGADWHPVENPFRIDGIEAEFRTWISGSPFPKEIWIKDNTSGGLNTSIGPVGPGQTVTVSDNIDYFRLCADPSNGNHKRTETRGWFGMSHEDDDGASIEDMYD